MKGTVLQCALCVTGIFLTASSCLWAQENEAYLNRVRQYKSGTAHALYYEGKIDEARAAFERQLAGLKGISRSSITWNILTEMIWFEGEVGNFRRALSLASQAVDAGGSLFDRDRDFRKGRSLCSLGRVLADVGSLELALKLYDKALEMALSEQGVKLPPLWGLASQEKGLLLTVRGDLSEAEKVVTQPLEFARERGIPIAVAEGEYLLGNIALQQGRPVKAREHFADGLSAAEGCACSYVNVAWGKVYKARAALDYASSRPEEVVHGLGLAREAISYSEATKYGSTLSRAQIYYAAFQPLQAHEERFKLLSAAASILSTRLAQLLKKEGEESVTTIALANIEGFAPVSQEYGVSFAALAPDPGYVNAEPDLIPSLSDDLRGILGESERKAAELASNGSIQELFEAQNSLADKYFSHQLWLRAHHWGARALQSLEKLIQQSSGDEREMALISRTLVLERIVKTLIELDLPRFDAGY